MARIRRKRCECGELYEPKHNNDNICPECRYFLRALYNKNIYFVERLRAEYIKRCGRYLSYGQFVAQMQQIERRRKGDSKKEKGNT